MVPAMLHPSRPITWLWSAVSALLLVVIATHAVEPLRADHLRVRGSAFSASTEEVSLKAAAPSVVARQLVQLDPVLPPQPLRVLVTASVQQAAVPAESAVPGRSPATGDPALHPLSPRAPPLA